VVNYVKKIVWAGPWSLGRECILLAGIVLGNLGIEAGWVFGKYGRFI
jgi:hypothetical protein